MLVRLKRMRAKKCYQVGGLYALGRPPSASTRFIKVLAEWRSAVYVRAFAQPPELSWDLTPEVPKLQIGPQALQATGDRGEVVEVDRGELEGWVPHLRAGGWVGDEESGAVNELVLERIPVIRSELQAQLLKVEPSRDRRREYRPCRVHLRGGGVLERALLVEAKSHERLWGLWLQHSEPEDNISIEDLSGIMESPARLPARLATKAYEAGETGMGSRVFTLVLRDGSSVAGAVANIVDFLELPRGVTPDTIVDLIPHEQGQLRQDQATIMSGKFSWCFYRVP